MVAELRTPDEIRAALIGKTIADLSVRADSEGGVMWIGMTLSDGGELEFSAHGMHTEGWLIVEFTGSAA